MIQDTAGRASRPSEAARDMEALAEQRALKLSIAVTALTGVAGILGGLVIGSRAITFDGMYSFVDVALTFGALAVAKLLMQEPSPRFQYGYWHLEPLIAAAESAILVTACLYAVIDALRGLMNGGNPMAYGAGLAWAGLMGTTGFVMADYMSHLAHRQRSILLAVDARAWLMSGFVSLALLFAYAIAVGLTASGHHGWAPYVDPAVLLCISLALLPVPLKTLRRAMRDVLEVAPEELDRRVRQVVDELVRERGFLTYSSHVAQIGRGQFVEIHILVAPDYQVGTVAAVDGIRRDVAARLDASWPQVWLTVDVTTDPDYL
ncbi:cation diffusion facilitator family transporter [Microvirga lotononidis]|uniref:Cation diffusion facilitator family transporter n=1 Tax=Microvirga lotononidis TaxID=864069 RepID=I4YS41_9HYPH|nr:cation diffusion facilitator family transporter [Microvirga lotononidis]EIM26783.1 cation diffusion facilitator family transporter [Microvirga lotononidis]WQO31689.1 cation diffusion facilitator family transporter [Microvirga lotononidis]